MDHADKRRAAKIDKVYARIPEIACQGLCFESCGPIAMSRVEHLRIVDRVGSFEPAGYPSQTCPLLKENKCSIYDIRPAICRLWGVVEMMPCPFGCVPEKLLTREQGFDILSAIRRRS